MFAEFAKNRIKSEVDIFLANVNDKFRGGRGQLNHVDVLHRHHLQNHVEEAGDFDKFLVKFHPDRSDVLIHQAHGGCHQLRRQAKVLTFHNGRDFADPFGDGHKAIARLNFRVHLVEFTVGLAGVDQGKRAEIGVDVDLVDVKILLRAGLMLSQFVLHPGKIHQDGRNLHIFLRPSFDQGLDKTGHLAQVEQLVVESET